MALPDASVRHPARWLFAPVEVARDFYGIHHFTPLADFISRVYLKSKRRRVVNGALRIRKS